MKEKKIDVRFFSILASEKNIFFLIWLIWLIWLVRYMTDAHAILSVRLYFQGLKHRLVSQTPGSIGSSNPVTFENTTPP